MTELTEQEMAIWGDALPEEQLQPTEQQGEAEEEIIEDEPQDEAPIDDEPQEEDAPEEPQQKKRAERIPRARFDEVNEAKRNAEERSRRLEWELEQQREANKLLLKKAMGAQPEPEDDNEVLDTVLEKKLGGELEQLKTQQVVMAVQADVAATAPADFDDAFGLFVAGSALKLINDAQALGYDIDQQSALAEAEKQAYQQMLEVYKRNPKRGNVVNYIYNQAKLLGYTPKASGQAPKNGVNMNAVDRARREAGAPTIHREAVQMTTSQTQVDAQRSKALRAEGLEDKYLKQFGL
jgi:hypothetical protein